jgi:hypothetical protein
MRHVAPRDVDHLLVLDMEARLRIVLHGADMVEVGMREDYIGLGFGVDVDPGQRLARPADEVVSAAHALGLGLGHAGVDDPVAPRPLQCIREEVEALDHLGVVAAEEHVALGPLVLLGVADGVDLVLGQLRQGRLSARWPTLAAVRPFIGRGARRPQATPAQV